MTSTHLLVGQREIEIYLQQTQLRNENLVKYYVPSVCVSYIHGFYVAQMELEKYSPEYLALTF